MTTLYPQTQKAPYTPAGTETYRISRPLTLDEEARDRHNKVERTFRHEDYVARPFAADVITIAVVTGITWALAHLGFWFLDSAVMLQMAVLGLSLHTTRRVFSLVHARTTTSAAHYRLGQYQRYVTGADAAAVLAVALLGLLHLSLAPNMLALAVAGVMAVVLGFRQCSHRSFILVSKRDREQSAMEELTAGL